MLGYKTDACHDCIMANKCSDTFLLFAQGAGRDMRDLISAAECEDVLGLDIGQREVLLMDMYSKGLHGFRNYKGIFSGTNPYYIYKMRLHQPMPSAIQDILTDLGVPPAST